MYIEIMLESRLSTDTDRLPTALSCWLGQDISSGKSVYFKALSHTVPHILTDLLCEVREAQSLPLARDTRGSFFNMGSGSPGRPCFAFSLLVPKPEISQSLHHSAATLPSVHGINIHLINFLVPSKSIFMSS